MGIEVGILFAFGAMLCWAFGDFFIQKCCRKIGDIESLAYIGILGSIVLIPLAIKNLSSFFSLPNLMLLILLGVITFIAAIFDFEALKKGKISIVDVIIELELPVTIILAFVFFRETLSLIQFIVISFVFIGIILIATKSFSHWKTRLERGALLALIAAIGMGGINFLTAASSRAISPIMAIWFPWVIFTALCFVVLIKRGDFGKFIKNGAKFKWIVLAMAIFDTAAWLFYAYAIIDSEIAITTAITESYPAIAMFLGIWLNKEKINWHQYLGAFLALGASFVLAFVI